MKKIFFVEGAAKVEDVENPCMTDGWVVIKTHYSFISSGTERQTLSNQSKTLVTRFVSSTSENVRKIMQLIKSDGLRSTMYQIKGASKKALECGYASSGQVVWAHPDSGFKVGDLVACAGTGYALHAEFAAVPKNLTVKLQDSSKLKQSSCAAIAAVAMQGFRQIDCKLGESVVVFGLGLVGLLAVQIAKAAGCKVIGIDLEQSRLDLAQSLGCDKVLLASDPGLELAVNFFTAGHGADAVMLCASSGSALLDAALNLLRRKGKVVVVGDSKLEFAREKFYAKEATVLASCSYGPGRYHDEFERQGLDYPIEFVRWTETRNLELCVQMIEGGSLKIDQLVSAEFEFDSAAEAFESIKQKQVLGVMLSYQALTEKFTTAAQQDLPAPSQSRTFLNFTSKKYKFNVAFVGTGGFARTKLIPELLSLGQANLYCLVDSSSTNLLNAAQQFNVEKKYGKIELALADQNVDVIVIATPHAAHASLAMQALEAGKAVFVEKPPAVNLAQLEELQEFLHYNPQAFYAVDFNRSSSPYFDKIYQAVAQRSCPLMIDYRVNAGFIAPTHWVFSPENNGRIIGEACHMVEFFLALVEAPVLSLTVNTLGKDCTLARDNFSASMAFADGSQATLFYTSLGNISQEKERVEIFWEGRSLVLSDFVKLESFGMSYGFNKSSYSPEKGHKQMLNKFFECLRSHNFSELKNMSTRALEATRICILIQELVDQGGGFLSLKKTPAAKPSATKNEANL